MTECPGVGVGTNLASIINRWLRLLLVLYRFDSSGCNCASLKCDMDLWGPDKCEEEIERIVRGIKDNARANGIPFSRSVALRMVRSAIKKERARCASVQKQS